MMLRRPGVVAAPPSRKPYGIHQNTSRAKKLIPKEATASPRTVAWSSWTSIMADSGPFIPINSVVRGGRTIRANREPTQRLLGGRRGLPEDWGFGRCKDRRA
jgi:hypothetical protein